MFQLKTQSAQITSFIASRVKETNDPVFTPSRKEITVGSGLQGDSLNCPEVFKGIQQLQPVI